MKYAKGNLVEIWSNRDGAWIRATSLGKNRHHPGLLLVKLVDCDITNVDLACVREPVGTGMTYDELQKVEIGTPVEVWERDKVFLRGEITGKTHQNDGRAIRVQVLMANGQTHDCIPSIVHIICPLRQLAEIQ